MSEYQIKAREVGCECEEPRINDGGWACERCEAPIVICDGCYITVAGCKCGNCNTGLKFHESEE